MPRLKMKVETVSHFKSGLTHIKMNGTRSPEEIMAHEGGEHSTASLVIEINTCDAALYSMGAEFDVVLTRLGTVA
jgi:hypothetical protein